MPTSEQIKLYWLKWIDRQYAKADPSHVKMRPEVSKPGKDTGAVEDATEQKPANKVFRLAIVASANSSTGGRKR
jgi:hypothetical protein